MWKNLYKYVGILPLHVNIHTRTTMPKSSFNSIMASDFLAVVAVVGSPYNVRTRCAKRHFLAHLILLYLSNSTVRHVNEAVEKNLFDRWFQYQRHLRCVFTHMHTRVKHSYAHVTPKHPISLFFSFRVSESRAMVPLDLCKNTHCQKTYH